MENTTSRPRTLFDKVWESHVVVEKEDGRCLLYVDRHLLHEGTTPLAFDGLRRSGLSFQRADATLGVIDHTIPTTSRAIPATIQQSRDMMAAFHRDTAEFGIKIFGEHDPEQGIVHVVGPEQGFTLPGAVIVCGDSHTSTHGAFGAFAFGIGATDVEHVFATRSLWRRRPGNMLIWLDGTLSPHVTAKDLVLGILGQIGVADRGQLVIEYAGPVISALSMEQRMTICNMSIEAGARAGMMAPDQTTIDYLKDRPFAPRGEIWEKAIAYWKQLRSDPGAEYDESIVIDVSKFSPVVTWGTTPGDVVPIAGNVPDPATIADPARRADMRRALDYMGLSPGMEMESISVDHVFIGSCTNGRIEDLRAAAEVARGKKVAPHVTAMVVPGSGMVKRQAEAEGIAQILIDAGFDWREPGCSMCLAMNGDSIGEGERCASTSNRNFEGRQGRGGRTHLLSPAAAAATAIAGHLAAPPIGSRMERSIETMAKAEERK